MGRAQYNRVAFFAYYNWAGVSTPLLSALRVLSEAGYVVDVYTVRQRQNNKFHLQDARINIYQLPFYSPRRAELAGLVGFTALALAKSWQESYDCFFGIDAAGLVAAVAAGRAKRVPVMYYSLEMLVSQDIQGWQRQIIKKLERRCHRNTICTIALTSRRARVLLADNQFPDAQVEIVPVARTGPAIQEKSDFLRQKFHIPADKKIILVAGAIDPLNLTLELAQAALTWPVDWVLVLHGWVGARGYEDQVRAVVSRGANTIVSTDVVTEEELDSLVASADVGVALYRSGKLNVDEMASSKIAQYLRCGLPVVATDFPTLVELVESNECGVCVHDVADVEQAIQRVLGNYAQCQESALRVYEQSLRFEKHFQPVLNYLGGRVE